MLATVSDIDVYGPDLSSSLHALIQIRWGIKKIADFTFAEPVDSVKNESFSALAAERADQVQTAVVAAVVSVATLINV